MRFFEKKKGFVFPRDGHRPRKKETSGKIEMSSDLSKESGVFEKYPNLYKRINKTCWNRCVNKQGFFAEILGIGEKTCVDRCAVKYFQAFEIVVKALEFIGINVDRFL